MGKRSRRINSSRPEHSVQPKAFNEVKFFLTTVEPSHSEPILDAVRLPRQVKDCINEIYNEHINDLEQRKFKRLESKNPTDYFQPYNLVVNSTYQQRIKSQIQEVIKLQQDAEFKESLISSADTFVEYLQRHIQEFNGKKNLLRVIILYEAFHTLQNCITQVGAIVDDIISRFNFEVMFKTKFYIKVAVDYFALIDSVAKKENNEYIEDLLRMKAGLEVVINRTEVDKPICIEYCSTLYSDSCSDEDVAFEPLHNLPIDELVLIINQDQNKKNKRSKKKYNRSTKENSVSPYRECQEIDNEIEDFKQRLELEKPMPVKLQPSLSEEFLARLRQQIRFNKVD